jgi:hypothetical protein
MTKIININRNFQSLTLESYITTAWHFALLALWPFEKVKKERIKRCKSYIKGYLLNGPDMQASFITFCEKILLVNRTLSATSQSISDSPAIWLNPSFKSGFATAEELHRLLKSSAVHPHYLQGITVLAKGYWDFINRPAPSVLLKTHNRLYHLRQYGLISLLSQVTLKYILVSKQLI